MTSGLEFEGKNIENAIKKACEKLKIREEKLKYDVISYGSTGIFGLVGTKKAKIRVTSPKQMKTRKAEKNTQNMESLPVVKPENFPKIDTEKETEWAAAIEKEQEKTVIPEENVPEEPPVPVANEKKIEKPAEKDLVDDEKNRDQAVGAGKEVLQKIIDLITTGAMIDVRQEKNKIHYQVNGGNTAVMIGKKGQTLEAIQYIVEKIVNKTSPQKMMVQVDIEDYLESRRQNLEKLSTKLAEKAKRIGKPVTIGQMNSHDRRVVHLVLKHDTSVRTQSIGQGFYRKLIIFPKRKK